MQMDEGLDTGPMLAQSRLAIGPQETGGSLSARLAELGGRLLGEKLPSIFQGSLVPTPQDSTLATLAPRLTREDALLDFSRAAPELHDRVRAFQPWPGATIRMASGGGIKVLATAVAEGVGRPGEILAAGKDGIVVAAGAGALRLLEVQPEGKRPMKAFAFLHGHPLAVGSLIGAS